MGNHNRLGTLLMSFYNNKGTFENRGYSAEEISETLRVYFKKVETRVERRVVLFEAREPRGKRKSKMA
ncbi:hypothetical protein B0O99DRAFT_57252 [Bisporella sp. PMI_857]|nr:hypothetical protein B0O99DRAFT_57252 [Bisporella sp. PMI_857]